MGILIGLPISSVSAVNESQLPFLVLWHQEANVAWKRARSQSLICTDQNTAILFDTLSGISG